MIMENRVIVKMLVLAVLVTWIASCTTSVEEEKISVTTGSESARLLYLRADTLFEKVYISKAIALLGEALAEDPDFFMDAYGLATHYMFFEDNTDFQKHAAQAIQSKITLSKGENLLKAALQKLLEDQNADVREFGKELVKLYPDAPNPHDSKGDYYMAVEEYGKAYDSFMKAVDIDSTWTESLRKANTAMAMINRDTEQ